MYDEILINIISKSNYLMNKNNEWRNANSFINWIFKNTKVLEIKMIGIEAKEIETYKNLIHILI